MVPVACVALLMLAGGPPATAPARAADDSAAVLEGFWPTERMVELLVRRTTTEAADRYELTEDQRRRIEDRMVQRWREFLAANRQEMQPLVNEYIEARLALEPPTQEQVRGWAARARPVADQLRRHIETGNREIRELLTPLQKVKFDSESLEATAAIEALYGRLCRWERGELPSAELWPPPRGLVLEPGSSDEASEAPGPDQVELELDRWDRYVVDFIAGYGLDEGQQRTATSILREVKERARAHRDRCQPEIVALEQAIASATEEGGEKRFRADLARLYGPIDALFAELRERLERVPTAEQRRTARQDGPEVGRKE